MKINYSRGEDCKKIAYELKKVLKEKVSFNYYGIDNPILEGVFCKNRSFAPFYKDSDVMFFIKYNKSGFLRIAIDFKANKKEDIINAMEELIIALTKISIDEKPIGMPLAMYETDQSLVTEYAFTNVIETINALETNTLFKTDEKINNIRYFNNCNNCINKASVIDCDIDKELSYCTKKDNEINPDTLRNCDQHEYVSDLKEIIKTLIKNI